jgi:hypothetical protein
VKPGRTRRSATDFSVAYFTVTSKTSEIKAAPIRAEGKAQATKPALHCEAKIVNSKGLFT